LKKLIIVIFCILSVFVIVVVGSMIFERIYMSNTELSYMGVNFIMIDISDGVLRTTDESEIREIIEVLNTIPYVKAHRDTRFPQSPVARIRIQNEDERMNININFYGGATTFRRHNVGRLYKVDYDLVEPLLQELIQRFR